MREKNQQQRYVSKILIKRNAIFFYVNKPICLLFSHENVPWSVNWPYFEIISHYVVSASLSIAVECVLEYGWNLKQAAICSHTFDTIINMNRESRSEKNAEKRKPATNLFNLIDCCWCERVCAEIFWLKLKHWPMIRTGITDKYRENIRNWHMIPEIIDDDRIKRRRSNRHFTWT